MRLSKYIKNSQTKKVLYIHYNFFKKNLLYSVWSFLIFYYWILKKKFNINLVTLCLGRNYLIVYINL